MSSGGREADPSSTIATRAEPGPRREKVPSELPIVSVHGAGVLSAQVGAAGDEAELTVREVLGVGGMGRVLLGRQRSLQRDVAMKLPHDGMGLDDDVAREARIVGSLEHPNVVPVHLLARAKGTDATFFVMKRIEGVRWLDLLRDPEHPQWARVPGTADRLAANLEIFASVCNAVAFASERGVVHRDVKPENVMVGSWGEVYLTDWGAALELSAPRATSSFTGTPSYAAPEMVAGDERAIDARTDVFLLGATLHHVLTGAPPHAAKTVDEALALAREARPPAYGPEVPAELASLCRRAMARDRAERPASALALRDAVREHVRHRDALALIARAESRVAAIEQAEGEVDRAMLEARIAIEGAAAIWPGAAALPPLRERALRAMLAIELGRERAEEARALARELEATGADAREVRERVAALEGALRERREREAKLAAMAKDLDLAEGAQARTRLMWATAIVVALSAGAASLARWGLHAAESAWPAVATAAVPALGFAIVVAALRREVMATTANRRAIATIGALFGSSILHRTVGAVAGLHLSTILATDLAGFAAIGAIGTAFGYERLVPIATFTALAAIAAAAWPAIATGAYLASIAGFAIFAYVARRSPQGTS